MTMSAAGNNFNEFHLPEMGIEMEIAIWLNGYAFIFSFSAAG